MAWTDQVALLSTASFLPIVSVQSPRPDRLPLPAHDVTSNFLLHIPQIP